MPKIYELYIRKQLVFENGRIAIEDAFVNEDALIAFKLKYPEINSTRLDFHFDQMKTTITDNFIVRSFLVTVRDEV